MDRELDALLGEIEKRWRAEHENLRGLVYKGPREKGLISESTWHAWRNGETEPSFVALRELIRAVGLDVRLLTDAASTDPARSTIQVSGGTYALKPETTEVVRLMESLPDTARAAIRDAAFQKNGELQSDPLEPDGERTRSPLARQK